MFGSLRQSVIASFEERFLFEVRQTVLVEIAGGGRRHGAAPATSESQRGDGGHAQPDDGPPAHAPTRTPRAARSSIQSMSLRSSRFSITWLICRSADGLGEHAT